MKKKNQITNCPFSEEDLNIIQLLESENPEDLKLGITIACMNKNRDWWERVIAFYGDFRGRRFATKGRKNCDLFIVISEKYDYALYISPTCITLLVSDTNIFKENFVHTII